MDCLYDRIDAEDKKILELIRFIAPDLGDVNDDIALTAIGMYRKHLWKERFGSFYYEALAYYTAHNIKIHQLIGMQGAEAGGVTGGQITSEREGDLSRSYGSVSGSGGGYSASLGKTAYGLEFLRIRDMAMLAACTRFG